MWPDLIELSVGQSVTIATVDGPRTLTLRAVREMSEPDHWIADNPHRCTLCCAAVEVDVAGRPATLLHRPFEMPVVVEGLRLYVETTRHWACDAQIATLDWGDADVRLSVLPATYNWGPSDLRFPLRDYRWRANSYNNTWAALVPQNKLYYHRGEDFGAIPDLTPVQAVRDGFVIASPLSQPQGSNTLAIAHDDGHAFAYAHMNLDQIDPALVVGATVRAGQVLGRTGCTWDSRPCQHHDPHLHLGLHVDARRGYARSPYPYLVDAYFREYDDPVLPVAGGYVFTTPGRPVTLDASRSVARPGRAIKRHEWRLPDGSVHTTPTVTLTLRQPGLHSAELRITTDRGEEDRDFAQVRVYDPQSPDASAVPFGWAFHHPHRRIAPGVPVLFWNRLANIARPAGIDFGDGSPPASIMDEVEHAYAQPGLYTVTLRGQSPAGQPATVQMRVRVEPG